MSAGTTDPLPLDDEMLAMDVADTVRHDPTLAEGDAAARTERLRDYYQSLGITISDETIAAGLAAGNDNRFAYAPRRGGPGVLLARAYINRGRWRPVVTALGLMLLIALGGYFLLYRPWRDAQVQQAQTELTETIPAQLDALYQTVHEETKVQQAETDAAAIRDRGKEAAQAGDRVKAEAAIADLTNLRDVLQAEYQLKIADRPDAKWGFWMFPPNNSEATSYYLVVQAIDADGNPLTLPIRDESTGRTERVSIWAERVPEEVYRAVEADKNDDGQIEHNLMAVKEYGFLDPVNLVQMLGGELTRW